MGQKVWVIEDRDWNPSLKNIPVPNPSQENLETEIERLPLPEPSKKSPALAFSLSMLVWGGGQIYLGEYRPGLIYMGTMSCFYTFFLVMFSFWDGIMSRVVAEGDILPFLIALSVIVLFFAGLALWLANAVMVYYKTIGLRLKPFDGVNNKLYPVLGSLLFPGWGQFLNGQPKKGIFFLLFGLLGLSSTVVLCSYQYIWPLLNDDFLKLMFEFGLIAAFLLIPISFLMVFISTYDAFRSSLKLDRKRLSQQNACYKVGSRWTLRSFVPSSSTVLGLLLAISLGMQFFPKGYYLDSLKEMRKELRDVDMQIIPGLIEKSIEFIEG